MFKNTLFFEVGGVFGAGERYLQILYLQVLTTIVFNRNRGDVLDSFSTTDILPLFAKSNIQLV